MQEKLENLNTRSFTFWKWANVISLVLGTLLFFWIIIPPVIDLSAIIRDGHAFSEVAPFYFQKSAYLIMAKILILILLTIFQTFALVRYIFLLVKRSK